MSINLAWSKLDDYYIKLDDTPAYAAALILHPSYRFDYCKASWADNLESYFEPMKAAVRSLYEKNYRSLAGVTAENIEERPQEENLDAGIDFFDLHQESLLPSAVYDEFSEYAEVTRLKTMPTNLYQWWNDQSHLPSMQKFAFDLLSIPAMSAEAERVFSKTRQYISDNR